MDERSEDLENFKNAKEGDTIKIEGVPIKIASQKELDDSAVKGNLTMVCMPCSADSLYVVPGSTKALCGECRCECWISPATKQSTPMEAFIRCMDCFMKDMNETIKKKAENLLKKEEF